MTGAEVEIARVDPAGDLAIVLLRRYFDELAGRFPGGFDADSGVTAPVEQLVAPHGAFLVARLEDAPVGCGAVRILDDRTAEIKRMWISPSARRRGVGRTLLTALEGAAHELGCDRVRLDTSAYLTEALGLYRSSGYVEITAYNDNPYAGHWLEKSLR